MKIGGVDPSVLSRDYQLVLPRGDDHFIVFKARSVPDMDEFNDLCPRPKQVGGWDAQGNFKADENNPDYVKSMNAYHAKQFAYIIVKSLVDIEWDSVNPTDPKTWAHWEADLKTAGFSEIERSRIANLVLEANALDEDKLKQARASFLRGQQKELQGSTGQLTEQVST